MKKLILLASITVAMLASSLLANASTDDFHYGFILSCGKTVYKSFDHSLSDEELLQWADHFESTMCRDKTPSINEV